MAIEIWDGSQWRNSSDPEIYTNTGWKDIMEGHAYIGNNVWNRFFIRLTPVAPTVGNVSRTNTSLTFSYSHPGDTSGVYLVLKLVRVSNGVTIAGPENTSLSSGAISGNKTYSGLSQGVAYRFEAYAVYNAYGINSTTSTTQYSTLSFTPTAPTLSLSSSTISSITVGVSLADQSPYKTQVTVYRVGNASNPLTTPATPAAAQINTTFTQSGLDVNQSYTFEAYAAYYDSNNQFLAISSTTTFPTSTLNYLITVPTTPQNTDRGVTTLDFSATSSTNWFRNGQRADAFIRFTLYRASNDTQVQEKDSIDLQRTNSSDTVSVQFTGLTSGVSYYCRARTYYRTLNSQLFTSQFSDFSDSSASIKTLELTRESTGLISASNTTFLTARLISASSTAGGFPSGNASDGSFTSKWYSNGTYSGTSNAIPVTNIFRDGKIVRYSTSSTFSAPRFTSASSLTVSAPSGISARQFSSRHTTRQTPTNRVADLDGAPIGTTFCFTGVNVQISGPTSPPSAAPFMPGGRTVLANNGSSITVPISPTSPIVTNQTWPGTITGPRPGLTVTSAPVSSFVDNSPVGGGIIIEVPTGSVPPTPSFSPIAIQPSTPVTMTISGQRIKSSTLPKDGDVFTEEVIIYVVPNSNYTNPRLIQGTNTIKVTIPRSEFTSDVSLSCRTSSSAGASGNNLLDQGSATISSGADSHIFNLQTTAFPYFDTFLNAPTFAIIIGGNRVFNTALNAPGLAITEIEFSFSYDVYS